MASDIEPIPLSAGFCELREKVNEIIDELHIISAGQYNPTITAETGISLSSIRAYYHRIGDYVFVSGYAVATVFQNQNVAFTLSVPITTNNFTDSADTNGIVIFGNFGSSTVATITGAVASNIGTQTIRFLGGQSDLGGSGSIAGFPVGFSFSYKIIV